MSKRKPANVRPNEPPMSEALAYFLTWTSYGTWLPGDERGWVRKGKGFQRPNPQLEAWCRKQMKESLCFLDREQRDVVEVSIQEHCAFRQWELLAVNCRVSHVHAVVAAPCNSKTVRNQLKARCSRKLNELQAIRGRRRRGKWWSEKGSRLFLEDEESLEAVVDYVLYGQ